jgi:CDP-diacylglycerol--serine O-phosphatidyltransferase
MNRNVILPNFVTLLGLFSGFYSIVATLNGNYVIAAYATLIAFIFDGLDGKIARMLNASSEFGIQLDSLADLISFGVAPALLVYKWALEPYGRLGWMAAFLFIACAALRLARFNVQSKRISNKFFIGLPSPAAAGVVVTSVLFAKHFFGDPTAIEVPLWFTFMIYILAFLMVSNVPYNSFKNIEYFQKKPFNSLVAFVLLIFVLGLYPEVFLFLLATSYAASGLITLLLRKKKPYTEEETQEI